MNTKLYLIKTAAQRGFGNDNRAVSMATDAAVNAAKGIGNAATSVGSGIADRLKALFAKPAGSPALQQMKAQSEAAKAKGVTNRMLGK